MICLDWAGHDHDGGEPSCTGHVSRRPACLQEASLPAVSPCRYSIGTYRWCVSQYLIEISAQILAFKDPDDGEPMVEKILDTAGQKGTGKWTVISCLDAGMPVPGNRNPAIH